MNQSVFMQLKADADLRASFRQAAAREQRPAAQVLHQLMRDYVVRHPAQGEPPRATDDDRGPDDLLERQYGWKDSPFGAD